MSKKSKAGRHRSGRDVASQGTALNEWEWPALTGLRGLAALGVFALHAFVLAGRPATVWPPLAWLFGMGGMGVDVFFVLSAFLLTIPYLRAELAGDPRPDWRRYAGRRVARILPAYYVQIGVLLALGAVAAGGMGWRPTSPGVVIAHLTFWINAWPLVPAHLPPWWTLPTELSFYLFLPALTRLLQPGRRRWLLALILMSLGWRWALQHADISRPQLVFWIEQLPGRLHQFLIGMLAADVVVRARVAGRVAIPHAGIVAAAATVAFVAMPAWGFIGGSNAYVGGFSHFWYLLPWSLLAALCVALLLVALAERPRRATELFGAAPLRGLGVISYSLYLWHYPILLAVREGLGGFVGVQQDFVPFLVYGGLASLSAAIASWWLVERPAQAWGRRVRLPA